MVVKVEDWQPTASPPLASRQYSVPEDRRKTKEGKVPLATFPSPVLGQWNETADHRDLQADKASAVPAAAATSLPLEHQDLFPWMSQMA